jgi:hypothetical protein
MANESVADRATPASRELTSAGYVTSLNPVVGGSAVEPSLRQGPERGLFSWTVFRDLARNERRFRRDYDATADDGISRSATAPTTVRTYIRGAANFAKHSGKSPDQLGAEQIRQHQLFLIKEKGVALSTYIRIIRGIRFLYTHTLRRQVAIERIPLPGSEKSSTLGREEVKALLDASKNLDHRTLLSTMYAAGPRISEVTNIRVSDIDSSRNVIWIPGAKGRKDRQTLLPPKLLECSVATGVGSDPRTGYFRASPSPATPSFGLQKGRASRRHLQSDSSALAEALCRVPDSAE